MKWRITVSKLRAGLLFRGNAEEAMNFYRGVFKDFEELSVARMPPNGPAPEGTVIACEFRIRGMDFVAINADYDHKFNEANSYIIDCADQAEVDYYWDALLADGGKESMCGWLWDKFGITWQVTPTRLPELISDPDPGRAGRAMQAMMTMRKIDIAAIEAAANAG